MMKNWQMNLNAAIKEVAGKRVNGNPASVRTQKCATDILHNAFTILHEKGKRVEKPSNITEEHIRIVVRHWWFDLHHAPKTIQNEISILRTFFKKLNKPGLVKKLQYYLPEVDPKQLVIHTAAQKAKSWYANEINIDEIFSKVDLEDQRLGLMLRMELALGLRREEVLKCLIHVQDNDNSFNVLSNQGKGGKPRLIPIKGAQRKIIDSVKERAPKEGHLGWDYNRNGTRATLIQNMRRYSNKLAKLGITKKKLGVTAHGLRAQFAENQATGYGLIPPSLGGTINQMPKNNLKNVMTKIGEDMGHHRPGIVPAYFCDFTSVTSQHGTNQCKKNILQGLALLPENLPEIMDAHRADCLYIREIMDRKDIPMTSKQAQAMWVMHSARFGLHWAPIEGNIAVLLEVVAIELMRKNQPEG